MIVRQSTYNTKCEESRVNARLYRLYSDKYYTLVEQYNTLANKYNSAIKASKPSEQFTQDEISKLILLCHPDKHGGKTMATEITQKLLLLRK